MIKKNVCTDFTKMVNNLKHVFTLRNFVCGESRGCVILSHMIKTW